MKQPSKIHDISGREVHEENFSSESRTREIRRPVRRAGKRKKTGRELAT